MDVNSWLNRDKIEVASILQRECENGCFENLNRLLELILNPESDIDSHETIEWCKTLIAAGRSPEQFKNHVKEFDNSTSCGLVWTPNFVAYRCRTCGISPCMSLCKDCFTRGNHETHDYNWFYSQAGGACDCGDPSVMRKIGFCGQHGKNNSHNQLKPPARLTLMVEKVMPRMIFRLALHFREYSNSSSVLSNTAIVEKAGSFLKLLLSFNDMGGLMCNVITKVLTSHELYESLFNVDANSDYMRENLRLYNQAIEESPNPIYIPDNPMNIRVFKQYLDHMTFLEELVFWIVRYEFQQQLVCFLLKILTNTDYKEALIKAFVLHYSRIAVMLGESNEPDLLSNRVVHVSVQLFSNQKLAYNMTNDSYLLYVMILSLKHMMSRILVINRNIHKAVDCSERIMRDHCYWPLVSDLNNILSHKAIAIKFLNDADLLRTWFDVLLMFQGMNLNRRETAEHIEFEPNTYYAAFSAELEVSSYPMWSLVSHLKEEGLQQETKRFIDIGLQTMFKWLSDAGIQTNSPVKDQVTFHLPLHRYFAIFLTYAIQYQKLTLDELLPSKEMMELMFIHPLMIQVAIYEILNGLWVRNGLQIKGQALSYVRSNFSMSMVDADLYLLQVICTKIDAEFLHNFLLSKFNVRHFINLLPYEAESLKAAMFEGMLMFLAMLVSIRTYLGSNNCDLTRLEIVGWLSISNQTHSNLMDLMPERCLSSQSKDFESILAQVADFKEQYVDQSGAMYPGTYAPKNEVWENEYDPIHILLRVSHRKEFQTTLDRFMNYCRRSNKLSKSVTPWPPYRIPKSCSSAYEDPRKILQHRFMNAILFVALYKAVHTKQVSEQLLSLIVHFLHMTVDFAEPKLNENRAVCSYVGGLDSKHKVVNLHLDTFYQSDCVFENLRTTISDVVTSGSDPADEIFDNDVNDIDDDGDDNPYVLIEEPLSSASIENENRLPIDLDDESHMVLRNSPNTIVMLPYPLRADNVELPALPPPMQYPAVLAGNEVGRPVHPSDTIPTDGRIVPSASAMETTTMRSGRKKKTPMIENEPQMKINENMISLLLKCHSHLSGRLDSFQFNDEHHFIDYSSSIGDGSYFIGRLLEKIGQKDPICRQFVNETRMKLWPDQIENKQEQLLKETLKKAERKRKAREHQQKIMAEFTRNQNQFLESHMMDIDDMENQSEQQATTSLNESHESSEQQSEVIQYECAICKNPSYMDDDSNMGLVTLMQSSNIIGHQIEKFNQCNLLPITDEDYDTFIYTNMMTEFSKRLTNFGVIDVNKVFSNDPTAVMLNYSWPSTVHVQTCGHYVHLDCYGRYMETLILHQRQQHLSVDRGEYVCPVCRQLSNSVLPILSKKDVQNDCLNSKFKEKYMDIIKDIARSIKSTVKTKSLDDSDENMHLVLDSICMNNLQPLKRDIVGAHESYLMTCIARSNIEIELIQRGGNLCLPNPNNNLLTPKRNCISQLCQVLSMCSKIVSRDRNCLTNVWESLVGLPVANYDFLPVLLRDPTSILFQVILNIPVNFNLKYFTIIVRRVYHLLLYQILTQLLFNFSQGERMRLLKLTNTSDSVHGSFDVSLINHLKWIINKMSQSDFIFFDNSEKSTVRNNNTLIRIVVEKVESLTLHFLRIASIFKSHYFKHCLPEIRLEDSEFRHLVNYLDLNFMEYYVNGSSNYDNSIVPIPEMWFNHLFQMFPAGNRKQISAQNVLADFHLLWKQPRLLKLPKEYEKVFMFYHEKTCLNCTTIPTESAICLLCGRIICFKSTCCKVQGICEAVQHSIDCGNGSGIFLVIKSTYIIVIRGLRACVWGYIYLDIHDEDDHDNKRGKPLFLCDQRYALLERQWLTHRFDHLKKNWLWHRNAL